MGKSDHKYFNCSQPHEHNYVVGRYKKEDRPTVRQFLKDKCDDGTINNFTHDEVYGLIKDKLGLDKE